MGRTRNQHRALVAGGAVFLLGAWDAYGSGDRGIAVLSLVLGITNLAVAARYGAESGRLESILGLLNAGFALTMSYSLFQAGKQGLPWAWLLAAAVFIWVAWSKHDR